jgi:Zn-dependent protease with chaperone function
MRRRALACALAVALTLTGASAQTRIVPPANKYSPSQDVELGLKAAADARKQLPIMHDDAVTSYVQKLGERLTAVIPPELQHQEFRYTFEAVNVREINAFALPGGPMFVNRGMIEAANTEGEVVGVMAHELSHVILRHGTAQASKAGKYQMGQVAGAVLGAIIGGSLGSVVAQGTQFGLGVQFLRFGRDFERQADIEGSHLMAMAGYDPRDMANMFRTIEKQGGSSGPEWLSDHPNPGNRTEYIEKEAQMLRVSNPVGDTEDFTRVKAHLKSLPPAPTSEEVARAHSRSGNAGADSTVSGGGLGHVQPPSDRFRDYTEGSVFRISVPSNWRELPGSSVVTFAPDGAYGRVNGRNVFTHGIQVGIERNERHDLEQATDDFIDGLVRSNPRLARRAPPVAANMADRNALMTTLENTSEATGRSETIQVFTTKLRDGTLFYAVAVAPGPDFDTYAPTFDHVIQSVRIQD